PIERAAQLHTGMLVHVLDSTGAALADSRVFFVSPQVDNTTQTVLVKATIENAKGALRTSQFVRAQVVWGTRKAPVIPVTAVSRLTGQAFGFVAEQEKDATVARQKPLRLGAIFGNDYLVLEGIKPGDKVIVSGTQRLRDGAPVTPEGR